MDLEDELERQRRTAWAARSPEERVVRAAAVTAVAESGLAAAAVGVGARAPGFRLVDALGDPVTLADLTAQGPVVLCFYRGGWCPYCNLELRALQARLDDLTALGAALVAVSPELPDRSLNNAERQGLAFPVLYDRDNAVARRFGLVHPIAPEVAAYQRRNGNDVATYNGTETAEVPLPATYVIDAAGVVRWAFVDADYTRRAEPDDVLAAVRAI